MKISSYNKTKQLLDEYGLKAKKKFGQNFLIDTNVLAKIVDVSAIDSDSKVIEIGPGLGALTELLLEKTSDLTVYEIDEDMTNILSERLGNSKNLTIKNVDFLKEELCFDSEITVVANLPYYITTPILFKLLESDLDIYKIVVMVQKEVGERLTANKNTKDYNALSVIVQYMMDAKYEFPVSKEVFLPKPNVDSAIISLTRKDKGEFVVENEVDFFDFVKGCFKQRRKTLLNNLGNYGIDKVVAGEVLELKNIDLRIRAEGLSLEEFIDIYKELKKA